jgi:hypothetical protein
LRGGTSSPASWGCNTLYYNHEVLWERLSGRENNNLKSGAVKLKAHFAKKITARKAFLLGVGTDYIEAGVGEWRKQTCSQPMASWR